MHKFEKVKNQISETLKSYNIKLDLDTLLKDIDMETDPYNTFLLKYSLKYKVLSSLYNKVYPYDLETNKDISHYIKDKSLVEYVIENDNFRGYKFTKCIDNMIMRNKILVKGLFVNIRYNLDSFVRYLNNIKINLDYRVVHDNISNVYVIVKDSTSVCSKIILYELYKGIKSEKEIYNMSILTRNYKITVMSNRFIETYYDRQVFSVRDNNNAKKSDTGKCNDNMNNESSVSEYNISDISFCIREYLDRNGFLIHFDSCLIDFISYIIYLQDKRNKSVINILRMFLKFKFTGYNININKEEYYKTSDGEITVNLDNMKYIARYPSKDILNRLRYLNKVVYDKCYKDISVGYDGESLSMVNDKLSFINYKDYDVVLSSHYIEGSRKIEYTNKKKSNIFNYIDKRCHMYYSRSKDVLLIKFKEEINRELFILYLLSISNFKYILGDILK